MDITIKDVEHRYQMKTPFERLALYDINASIKEGSYVAVIGHTGSGKSTLLQHLNGLLKPTKGQISLGSTVIQAGKKNKDLKKLRKKSESFSNFLSINYSKKQFLKIFHSDR